MTKANIQGLSHEYKAKIFPNSVHHPSLQGRGIWDRLCSTVLTPGSRIYVLSKLIPTPRPWQYYLIFLEYPSSHVIRGVPIWP